MKKSLLLTWLFALSTSLLFSQTSNPWFANSSARNSNIATDKSVARQTFPKEFKLFNLNIDPIKQDLFSIVGNQAFKKSTVIILPNTNGGYEEFEVFEASNFEPALQARFPQIRAFSGKGITDKSATLKLSISPQGVQTMIFRTATESEFIEPYSKDHTIYAVFNSTGQKGKLPWACTTQDKQLAATLNASIPGANKNQSSTGQLKTLRLAQSVTAEYANYFGATSAAQAGLVLAAINATLTRCNGVYEKDLALHLNLIANTTDVIYYDPATDPYFTIGNWNASLQATLTAVIGEANYDIGHLFGDSGGGGNAGCIGCVCEDGIKGRGITSPVDGIPQGDNFDIDYVAHEVGHQLGANHTFSAAVEGTGVNMEVGSGITIMGYAGITDQDVAPHSIDIFHQASIAQIQANLATKACPVTTVITANNATPVVATVPNYTIPISTPFALTGAATDANTGDVLTYCWEQNDNSTTFGTNSIASPTKLTGPNWLSFSPTTSPTRYFPILSTILAGGLVTGPLPGGGAGVNIEALSAVARALNFRLTVRDNSPYVPNVKVGQTAFTDMTVNVSAAAGPVMVTVPNTNVTWISGAIQTVTWNVAGSNLAPVSCANVKISLSTDGGFTFPTVLLASTPNDGSENITVPSANTGVARIKVEAVGNIFFDISNSNFVIASTASDFVFNSPITTSVACGSATSANATIATTSVGGYTTPIVLSASGNPAGSTVSFAPASFTPGNNAVVTLNAVNTLAPGTYTVTVTGTSGSIVHTVVVTYIITGGTGPVINTNPVSQVVCVGTPVSFTVNSATAINLQWQQSADGGATWALVAGATSGTYSFTVNAAQNGYQYRCVCSTLCGYTISNPATLSVVTLSVGGTLSPAAITVCGPVNSTILTLSGYSGNIIQWQYSTDGGATFPNTIANTTDTLTAINISTNYMYRVIVQSSGCTAAFSTNATLTYVATTVGTVAIAANPGTILCQGDSASLKVSISVNSPTYIIIPGSGSAIPYPSTVMASGLPATGVTVSSVTLSGVNHTLPSDLDIVLQSPSGQNVILMSDAGGSNATGLNYTFDDAATALMAAGFNPSGSYKCTNIGTTADNFAAPGPGLLPITTPTTLSTFTGNLNGVWKLFVVDDAPNDLGSIAGFTITFGISGAPGLTYSWSPAAGLNNTTTNPVAASPSVSTTYKVIATNTFGCTGTASVALTINTRPTVTTHPVNVTVCVGSTASFTAAGTGTGFTYQWQESTNGGTSYTNITNGGIYSGATTETLSITSVPATFSNNRYRLSVNGTCPPVANSTGAILTVLAVPSVTVSSTANCGGVAGINGTKLKASGANTYTWSSIAGLYIDATATVAYIGSNADSVYASPGAFTTYTVTGTSSVTGCSSTAAVAINYTPNAPIINPAPANLCFGNSVLMLTKSQPKTLSFSTTVNVPIVDNNVVGANKVINVSGVPAGANITGIVVKMNAAHSSIGDLVVALKAPNGKILNLDYCISRTNASTGILAPGFANTIISSSGSASLSSGTQPYSATFKADASIVADYFGAPTGPTGFAANTGLWSDLYSVPNGNWVLAWADVFPGADVGTFTGWSIDISYQATPSTPPVWNPVTYLFTDAAATVPYLAGTPKDTVYVKPPTTPLPGSYTYKVTSNSLPQAGLPLATATTNFIPNRLFAVITFNVKNNNTYPVMLTNISSICGSFGLHNVSVYYKTAAINGLPGAISAANGWNGFGAATINATGAIVEPFISGLNLVIPAGATYGICVQATNASGVGDLLYSAITPGTYTFSAGGCDIVTGTNIGYGGDVVPNAPVNTPFGFIGSVSFAKLADACTSPEGTVMVTVNDSVKIVTQPVNTSICADKPGSFTVGATGTGLTYQWQVKTPADSLYRNITNSSVYSGVTTAVLTITAPPSSINGYYYVCVVSGISPCAGKTSTPSRLTVNPLPTIAINANPRKILPGVKTSLFTTALTPAAATYTWLKNGVVVTGAGSFLPVDVDGIGNYTLRVTDVNGCTNTSNMVSITDSASSRVFIYPNPTSGQFQVRYQSMVNNAGLSGGVNIYNAMGKRVLTQAYSISIPYSRMDVDLSGHGTGVYMVQVVDVNGNRLAMGRVSVVR
jgi:subtilisin-like proprotein convertase family protein